MNPTTLEVPGARLHTEARGSGPVLLLIPGGMADSDVFAGIVPLLADDYTVVTYDPRGVSRSTVDDAAQDVEIAVQADDAHRLLSAITTEPAYVFANSGGAITGLELVTQHPERVHTLVAHEPAPMPELLPDGARVRAAQDDLYDAYVDQGVAAALKKFLGIVGVNDPDPEMLAGMVARMQGTLELFFGHMILPLGNYLPDTSALQAAPTRVVIAAGTASTGQDAHRTAVALADRLGMPVVEFPGGHGGFREHPELFARTLGTALAETTDR